MEKHPCSFEQTKCCLDSQIFVLPHVLDEAKAHTLNCLLDFGSVEEFVDNDMEIKGIKSSRKKRVVSDTCDAKT